MNWECFISHTSLQAGLAFSNASLGLVHAMSHAWGGLLDLPHGLCNALLLPLVIEFNYPAAPGPYRRLGASLGLDVCGASDQEACALLTGRVRRLCTELGLVGPANQLSLPQDVIEPLAGRAMQDACMVTNPRSTQREDIQHLYEQLARQFA